MLKNSKEAEKQSSGINLISYGTKIVGTIEADMDIRIDGCVEGNITCKGRVVVGVKADIKGDISSREMDINGKVEGTLIVSELLSLSKTAVFTGTMKPGKIQIEPGACFNGSCEMEKNTIAVSVPDKK